MKNLLLSFFLIPLICFGQIQIGQTLSGNNINDNLGADLAFSSNNNRIVILDHTSGGNNIVGHAKVYDYLNNVWTQVGQTIDIQTFGEVQNVITDISSDGLTIAVGAQGYGDSIPESGSVRVFKYINNVWTQIGQEIFSLSLYERFTYDISLSSDGTTLVCSAPYNNNNGINSGYVKVFNFNNGIWENKGSIIEGSAAYIYLGVVVDVSQDGNILVFSSNEGVKVYEFINNDWLETAVFSDFANVVITPDGLNIALSNANYSGILDGAGRVQV